jgi:hypothetical protein
LNAVAAIVPAGALVSAAGAAGSGYLLHRADIAAAGAGTAAVGLAVERLQSRALRRRARRERWEWRVEREEMREGLDELRRDLAEAHHTLNVLQLRVQTLHERAGDERTGDERTGETPRPEMTEIVAHQRLAREAGPFDGAATMPLRRLGFPLPAETAVVNPVPVNPMPVKPAAGRPTPGEPERRRPLVTLAHQPAAPAEAAVLTGSGLQPPGGYSDRAFRALSAGEREPATSVWFETDHRSGDHRCAGHRSAGRVDGGDRPAPIILGPLNHPPRLPSLSIGPSEPLRTGSGVPLLPPGPRDPVSGPLAIVVDLAAMPRETTAPSPAPSEDVDEMVYAALAEAEADELTAMLRGLGDHDLDRRRPGTRIDPSFVSMTSSGSDTP